MVIVSRENPAVKYYRKLSQQKKFRQAEQKFVAEGFRLVSDALKEQACETVLATETAFARYREMLPEQTLQISEELGRYLSETEHTQGVFAVCPIPEQDYSALHENGRYLVACGLQDPGNLGMILRTGDALGIDAVLCSESCEIYSPKTVRATMGAVFRIPVYQEQNPEQLSILLKQNHIISYAAVLHQESVSVTETQLGRGCAVWIGNEGNGLSEQAVSLCDYKLKIPMNGNAESLNAAMAAGILMWEMMKS